MFSRIFYKQLQDLYYKDTLSDDYKEHTEQYKKITSNILAQIDQALAVMFTVVLVSNPI